METSEAAADEAVEYYNKIPYSPKGPQCDVAFVVDPVIATGNTAHAVIDILLEAGVKKVVYACILASLPGIAKLERDYPQVSFYAGYVDPELDSHGYINPG